MMTTADKPVYQTKNQRTKLGGAKNRASHMHDAISSAQIFSN
jgi:hypothetical protein